MMCTLAVWGWAIQDAYSAYLGEQWWSAALTFEARVQNAAAQATDEDYSNLIIAATEAFDAEPDNADYGYWLNSYRWASLSRVIDPETGEVLLHPDVLPFVGQIADELAEVRRICPTFGPPYALEGELRLFVLNQPDGAELIRKGVRLASYDPPTCLVAGELAARDGKLEEAEALLTRAVALQPAYFTDVIDIYLHEVKQPEMAQDSPATTTRDWRSCRGLTRRIRNMPIWSKKRRRAMASLRQRATVSDVSPYELAALARVELADGKVQPAIDLYRQALIQDYRQVDWRLELARLADSNQVEAAIHPGTRR